MQDDPYLSRRLNELERCLHQVCLYPGITQSGMPNNATRSLDELFRLVTAFKADSVQDAAKV